ncbi:MAG: hypothetical protein AAFR79_10560, partial [Pseudomonadota bacterium]
LLAQMIHGLVARKQSRVSLAEPDETIPDGDPDAETVLGAAQDAERVRECRVQWRRQAHSWLARC